MAGARGFGSLRTIRRGLLAGGVLMIAVVAGYVWYAQHRLHSFLAGLPKRLGADITQESDNVTYSQSVGGRTVFTVHAGKQYQHHDGTLTLHDVGIVLYGRKADRADRIHGSQFEYNQKTGVLTAVGEVFIDLAAPANNLAAPANNLAAPANGAGLAGKAPADDDARMIHVRTSGLVFQQKERSAETDQPVEFQAAGSTGTAVGASYDGRTGVVVLKSAVKVSELRGGRVGTNRLGGGGLNEGGGRPMVLTASRAELDRTGSNGAGSDGAGDGGAGDLIRLTDAKVVSATEDGAETGAAEHAVVHVAADGTPERVEAEGRVRLTSDGRGAGQGVVTADRMEMDLNGAGKLKAGHLFGTVRFADDDPARQEQGQAADLRIAFDGRGRPVHAVLTGGVGLQAQAPGSERRLNAEKVELALAGGDRQKVQVTGAVASGLDGARLLTRVGGKSGGTTSSGLRADVLTARFAAAKDGKSTFLTGVDGQGKTLLEQVATSATGLVESKQTSTGETMTAEFRPPTEAAASRGKVELVRAVQKGGVSVVRETAAKAGTQKKAAAAQVVRARADAGIYDADADRLTMTGGVQVADSESTVSADTVAIERGSGDSTAEGAVRVSYLQQGSTGDPVHVLAARAVAHKDTGVTDFYAAAGGRVRLWQGGSSVESPWIELNRDAKTMLARDEHGAEGAVRTVLVDSKAAEARPETKKKSGAPSGPVKVVSREMSYNDARRVVAFHGAVRVDDKEGTMRAQDATVYLTPASGDASPQAKGTAISLGGRVDHLLATGGVEIDQPGRRATGETLVYTASDELFVLTGTSAVPPRMVDEAQGSVTGAALKFRTGDDSVVISGSGGDSETRRVRSETKGKQ